MAQGEIIAEEIESGIAAAGPLEEVYPPHWRRNFVANFADVAFFSLGLAFSSLTTIVPLFIRQLGGSTLLVGLIPALVQVGTLLPPLLVAAHVARLGPKLPFILRMTLAERLPWPLLAIASFFLARSQPTALVALTVILLAIFGIGGGVTLPAWMDMIASVTPLRMRGRLFGWSGALAGLLGVGGGLLAEWALATYPFPLNFALCFTATAICMLLSYAALAAIREPARQPAPEQPRGREYLRTLPSLLRRDRHFAAFIAARMLMALGGMAVALVAVYATEQRGLPESLAGRFTSWMLGTQVIVTPVWGILSDRNGYKGSLQFAVGCLALAMALTVVATTAAWFYLIFILIGAYSGVLFATTLNMVVEFARPEERVSYIALHGSLVAPVTLAAPVLGGWLVEVVGFGPTFTIAAASGCLGLAVLSLFVRDPRYRQIEALGAR